jgi:hypothetical protein
MIFWYYDYGGETDVSLNCGRLTGLLLVPGWEWMSEWVNGWMKWMSERFFLFSGNVEPTVELYWKGKTEGLGEKPVPVPLCPSQIPLDWPGREPGPPRWEAGDLRIWYWLTELFLHLNAQVTRYTRFRYQHFRIYAVIFQCREHHQYRIRGHSRSCRAVSLTRSIILTPRTTNKGFSWWVTKKILSHVIRFPFYAFSIHAAICRKATPRITSHLCVEQG